ncbi:MAG TPA: preprotein translocase subunit SecA, partial [Thermus scotoductus]|nr:preprotein translocase subunit SecA [Thermus scotoductus]
LADFPFEELRTLKPEEGVERLVEAALKAYEAREQELSPPLMRAVERFVILNVVDSAWKEHLHNLDVLRQGIFLRGYGQKDPFQEYKIEATRLFNDMVGFIKGEVAKFLFRLKVEAEPVRPVREAPYVPVPAPQEEARPFGVEKKRPTTPPPQPGLSRAERRRLMREEKKRKKE